MKKNQQEIIYLPITGKDELNICECPFTLLNDKPNKEQTTLKFTDRQHTITRNWKIIGSGEYGLLTALDEPVFISMLYLTKQEGFSNPKVYFNQREMLQLMRWPTDGKHYHRLKLSFDRLVNTGIETNYLWDKGKFKKGSYTFHILEDKFLYDGKTKNTKNSWFTWGKPIFTSFENGNIKDLNIDEYFSLSTAISRRLFRLCSKRLYKNYQITFELQELCFEKLGISRNLNYPSLLKQSLRSAIKEHQERKLISSAVYSKTSSGKWLLTLRKHPGPGADPGPRPEPNQNQSITTTISSESTGENINPLLTELVNLGISKRTSQDLINSVNPEKIQNQIEALSYRKNIDDKPAFLIKAIQDNYPLPQTFKKKLAAKKYEKETKLKEEYNEYILAQVDEYLKTLNSEQLEKQIEFHQAVFFKKYPQYREFSLETVKPYIMYDYKMEKSKILNLSSFEEWKSLS